jgi:hypothetical protein
LSSCCIKLSEKLTSLIASMSTSSILPGSYCRFTVAKFGAANHIFLDKSAFISYKLVSNLCVRMGNNSYLPVLGHGLAIISLNGQRILVRNMLHVPGLVVPLYSFRCTSPNQDVDSLARQGLESLFIFRHLSCRLTYPRIAIFHSSLWNNLCPTLVCSFALPVQNCLSLGVQISGYYQR